MLTTVQALALASELVREKGAGFVYEQHREDDGSFGPRCRYVHNGACDCLVGHILVRANAFTIEELDGTYGPVGQLAAWFPRRMTKRAVRVLNVMQHDQDCHKTWGEAVDHAYEVAGLRE